MTAGDRQQNDVLIGGRRLRRPRARHRFAPGAGRKFCGDDCRSGFCARPHGRYPSLRHCRRGPAAVSDHRRVGAVADEAQPILDMVVTDSRLEDAVRPAFLSFGGEVAHEEPFAHMIENGPLMRALMEKAEETGVELPRRSRDGIFARRLTRMLIERRAFQRRGYFPRAFWSAPTARVQRSASTPASPPTAGTMDNPASSRPWRMSAIITAARKSISFPPGLSPSCR